MFENALSHPVDSHYALNGNRFQPMHTHRLTKTVTDNLPKRIGAPRQTIGQRKIAGEEIARATKEARTLLKNRPNPNPKTIVKHLYHQAYQTARIIVDTPSKKKKPVEGGAGSGI